MFGFFSFYSILVLVLTLIYVPIYTQKRRVLKDNYFYFACFVLLFFAMCRGTSVGGDLAEYIPLFQKSDFYQSLQDVFRTTAFSGYEVGFLFLCKLLSYVSFDSRWFIAATSFLSLIGPFYLVYNHSKNKGLSLLLYVLLDFYNISFNNVRQAIAVSIVMISVCYLLREKKWCFFIGVILAVTIHTSAIFSLLLYPLVKLKYSPQRILLLMIALVGVFIVLGSFLFNYLISNVFTRYLEESGETYTTGGGYGLLAVYSFVLVVSIILFNSVRKKMDDADYNRNKFFLLSYLIVVLVQLFALYMAALSRLAIYFYVPMIVLLPNLFEYIRDTTKRRHVKIITYIFYYVLACNTFLSQVEGTNMNPTDTIPYVFLNGLFSW